MGIDLGGTKVALGLVDRSGRLIDSLRISTRARRAPSAVIQDIIRVVRQRWAPVLARGAPVGVGVAAQVGPNGEVLFAPNLRWRNVPLRALLARGLRRPVSVLNDVQAATYGEWKHGAGRGARDVVCLFVGTGVGGGIVADGVLRHGAHGTAGELGHLTVNPYGRRCRCPNRGCLEAYAGGWAIAARARAAVRADPGSGARLVALAGSPGRITSRTVEEAYRVGDPLARALMRETADYLAAGLISVVNTVGPQVIVLGGGVLAGYPRLVPALGRAVRRRALRAAVPGLRVVPAALGPHSGVVGAASYARAHGGR